MDIRHLHYFTEVARHLNFTKAAAVLHVSQPSLSKTIKDMEEKLGVKLFLRDFRQLHLTDAGKALLENAKSVLEAYNNLTTGIEEVINLEKGEIAIGIPPIIGASFCAKVISKYIDLYPDINVSLVEVGTKKIIEGIREGTLHIGFACNKPISDKDIESIPLIEDPLTVVVHRNHPLSTRSEIDYKELKKERFVLYQQDFSLHDKIVNACLINQFYPIIACESAQKDLMIQMVRSNLGIALLPSEIAEEEKSDDIAVIPLVNPETHLELCVLWKRSKYLPFAVCKFISLTEDFYKVAQ